ncbi:hypothetical protein EC9_35190 [Rosistilla ulvae]|uniref:DUF2752 domain-containing protein n=1 Tax=Rosistilla ulvae TaxID=1930277 RepID=A0A517M383_9BACT|nr:DUF2752 domain-containing protein [Rosistilla ulvae]QDS89320.1 hypothetical protein EC9_35190 [Rosistilla ulvae]
MFAAATVLIVAGGFLLHHFEPNETSWYPKCPLHEMTGLHCPGCGTTRAVWAILHGDVTTAIRMNPLVVLGSPVVLGLIWRERRRGRTGQRTTATLSWTILVVLIGYFIARNVPSPTRSWFAPPSPTTSVKDAPEEN